MNPTVRHLALGVTAGGTVFAIIVPLIHVVAAVFSAAGVELRPWDNPVEIFIFVASAAALGVFPWGLWIMLTDARKASLFDDTHDGAAYLIAAIAVYLALTTLVCTRLQDAYERYQWFVTPILFACGAALIYWRWTRVWRLPPRDILDSALALHERD